MAKINTLKKILISLICLLIFATNISYVQAAGTFSLTPALMTVPRSCNSTLVIQEEILSGASNAADIIITYDTSVIEIIDANPSLPGIQILPGNAYESYAGNIVNTTTGTIRLVGYSSVSTLTGSATFASINFKSKPFATNGNFTITFTGANPYATLDSNIADATTSYDMLSSVTNAAITFTSGSCETDFVAPTITFISPTNLANNVNPNATVNLTISDAGSGVDLSSFRITINGEDYTSLSPEAAISGSPANYTISIQPSTPFSSNSLSVISATVKDLAGNVRNQNITINANYSCPASNTIIKYLHCTQQGSENQQEPLKDFSPEILLSSPEAQLFSTTTPSLTIITRDELGIVPESFQFTLLGKTYSLQATPELITLSGNKYEYKFTISLTNQPALLNATGVLHAICKVSDTTGNTRIENFALDTGKEVAEIAPNPQRLYEKENSLYALLVLSLFLLLLSILTSQIKPTLLKTVNSTNHTIPFCFAIFVAEKTGKKYEYKGNLFGRIKGHLPHGVYKVFIQKYGYQMTTDIFINDDLQKTHGRTIVLKSL